MVTENEKRQMYLLIQNITENACSRINTFSREVLRTRGGRIGSGMGGLLEALWGYNVNAILNEHDDLPCELAWFPGHQYHDFACILKNNAWNMDTREGEFFRIEAKSMNSGADESKAHFDVLYNDLDDYDSLLILVWEWKPIDDTHFSPQIVDSFFETSKPIILLRDGLHLKRGGSFVDRKNCPDGCPPDRCKHHGEPLNEQGKRERLSGPESTRPSMKVSYAANFGGLVRMLKTNNVPAREEFRKIRRSNEVADKYIAFIHRNFPQEERNQYTTDEWKTVASQLGIDINNISKESIIEEVRKKENYMTIMKNNL